MSRCCAAARQAQRRADDAEVSGAILALGLPTGHGDTLADMVGEAVTAAREPLLAALRAFAAEPLPGCTGGSATVRAVQGVPCAPAGGELRAAL